MTTPATGHSAPPSSALWLDIAKARQYGWETFTDAQYAHLLSLVEQRFPGMDVLKCRPFSSIETILVLTWDAESLLSANILAARDIPQGRKRLQYRKENNTTVRRVRGGRLELTVQLVPRAMSGRSCSIPIGPDESFAMFLPDSIQAVKGTGRLRPPWLRLVVDNDRKEAQPA